LFAINGENKAPDFGVKMAITPLNIISFPYLNGKTGPILHCGANEPIKLVVLPQAKTGVRSGAYKNDLNVCRKCYIYPICKIKIKGEC